MKTDLIKSIKWFCVCILGAMIMPVMANALTQQEDSNPVTIDLTQKNIDINVSFKGATFTLFGVVSNVTSDNAPLNMPIIITKIIGPAKNISVRPITQSGPIYIPGEATIIRDIPGLYYISSSTPLNEALSPKLQFEYGFDIKGLEFFLDSDPTIRADDTLRDAIISTANKDGLYKTKIRPVQFLQNGLFSIELDLPAQTPVGDYTIEVTAWHKDQLIGKDNAMLTVRKTGVEQQIYEIAHQYSFFYGILCVLLSLLAGWAVSIIFRRS